VADLLIVLGKALFFLSCVLTLTGVSDLAGTQTIRGHGRTGWGRIARIFLACGLSALPHFFRCAEKFFKETMFLREATKVLHTAAPIAALFFAVDDLCRDSIRRFDSDCGPEYPTGGAAVECRTAFYLRHDVDGHLRHIPADSPRTINFAFLAACALPARCSAMKLRWARPWSGFS